MSDFKANLERILSLFLDYYDLTILSLNEALQEVSEGSRQAEMILRLRSMYDDRLTLLHDSSKYDIGGMIASVGDLSIDGSGRTTGNDEGGARTITITSADMWSGRSFRVRQVPREMDRGRAHYDRRHVV